MLRLLCLIMSGFLVMTGKTDIFAQDTLYVPELSETVAPRLRTLASEQREGYECRLVDFSVEKGERVKAYLMVPDEASRRHKCPALLMLHDHGARFDIGKEKLARPMMGLLPQGERDHIAVSSRQWIEKNFDGVYMADSLASLGYVVLVADALYWGERSSGEAQRWSELTYGETADASDLSDRQLDKKSRKDTLKALKTRVYDGQQLLYDSLVEDGVIWAEKMLRDDIASVRLLKSLPYVDADNIGAFGFSMGAHRCWMLSAFCDDVKCGVSLSWMTTLDRDERMKASDYSMAVMPMREQLDFGDIGLFLAPKPMLFLNGESDHLFPKERVETAFSKLNKHYSDYNDKWGKKSSAPLQTKFFKGGHHCGKEVQSEIVGFLNHYLIADN